MGTPDHPFPSTGRRPQWNWAYVLVPVIVIIAITVGVLRRPLRWQPDLYLTNTGTTAVKVIFHDETSLVQPGEMWQGRFRAADELELKGTQPDAASRQTVELPKHNPKLRKENRAVAQRWTADVNGDDRHAVQLENRLYAEITTPPSTPEPWP